MWVTDGGSNGGQRLQHREHDLDGDRHHLEQRAGDHRHPLSSVGTATTGTWVEFNLGSVITGNGTYTFAISGGTNDAVDYASRETANDPVLFITP